MSAAPGHFKRGPMKWSLRDYVEVCLGTAFIVFSMYAYFIYAPLPVVSVHYDDAIVADPEYR